MNRLLLLLALSAPASPAAAQENRGSATESYRGRIVREVSLTFEGGTPPEASRELVEVVPGDRYQPEAVRRSIHQLFSLGAFSDIKVEAFPRGEDGVEVLFRLFPRLEVEAVEIEGLERTGGAAASSLRKLLIEESRLRPGDPLEVEVLGEAAARIRAGLEARGYLWAEVEPEASFQSPTAVVVFHVDAGARARLGSLSIEGAEPHVLADIRREIGLEEGDFYSRADLDERVERLSARWKDLGFYDASMKVDESPSGVGRVDLRLSARVGPKIRVEVEGWDYSEKDLRRLVPLLTEARFTADLVEESRANLEEDLRDRGHRDAIVAVSREIHGDERNLVLRFEAEPGPRVEIRAIELEGLHSVPEPEVRALLVTRSRRRVRSAPFRQKVWDADLEEIRTYLRRQGFHRASVTSGERTSPEEPSLVTLVVLVEEGPRAVIGSIQVEGAEEVDSRRVLEASRLVPADPFDTSEVLSARERILTLYHNEGFRQAAVESSAVLDADGKSAVVSFVVREGERTRVDQVIFSGLRVTREGAARSLVALHPGEPLSALAVLETRQRLIGSGLFRSVEIQPLSPDPETLTSDVLIVVEEAPRTTFAYGFGYEEQQLARAEIEVTRRNLLGLNRSVSVFTRASFRGGRFITTYRQPDTFGVDLPLFVSAFAEEEDRTSFDYNRVGIGLQISKRLRADQNLLFRYRFDQTKVFQVEVDLDEIDRRFRNSRISALSVATVTDRRDDPLNPLEGQFRILDLEWSAQALGTEDPYLKALAQQFFYFPLPYDLVGAVGVRLGVGKTLRADRDALLPIPERFFAGGATTLRGFALDEASPRRKIPLPGGEVADGEPIGGNVLALLNLELRFPIFGNLRGVFFSDNGNVYRRLEIIELLNWRYNMGFGFRYDTPLGPLRLDYGFKLDRRMVQSIECPDVTVPCKESFGRWHVSLGHAF